MNKEMTRFCQRCGHDNKKNLRPALYLAPGIYAYIVTDEGVEPPEIKETVDKLKVNYPVTELCIGCIISS